MSIRFRKSIKIAPGVKLNVSKNGLSVSAGVKGARVSLNSKGRLTKTVGVPGTGISNITTTNLNSNDKKINKTKNQAVIKNNVKNKSSFKKILGIFFFIVGISGFFTQKINITTILVSLAYMSLGYFLFKSKGNKKVEPKNSYITDTNIKTNNIMTKINKIEVISDYKKGRKLVDEFVVFDLETTGLNPENSEIIQIGAIRYNNETEISRFNTYVKPINKIPTEITNINGITNEMVADAPQIREALLDFKDFIKDDVIIAHNTSFDMKFLQTYNNKEYGEIFYNTTLDTLKLARKYINTPNHKLETLKKFLKLDVGSHNSLDDCIVAHKVYMYCKNAENYITKN